MEVRFDATIDDVVDVALRSSADSKTTRLWRLQSLAVTALFAGIPVYLLAPGTPLMRLIGACYSALFFVAVTLLARKEAKRNLYKMFWKQTATDAPFRVTVQPLDEGLSFNQRGVRSIYAWSQFERLEESEDALYFFFKNHGCTAVRKRGFESTEMKDEFLKLAESYIHRSRGPNC